MNNEALQQLHQQIMMEEARASVALSHDPEVQTISVQASATTPDHQLNARQKVVRYYNERAEKTDRQPLHLDNTYIVWFCYILGNWKALISTTVSDGMYYEVTYDRDRDRVYLDAYKKWENVELRVHD